MTAAVTIFLFCALLATVFGVAWFSRRGGRNG